MIKRIIIGVITIITTTVIIIVDDDATVTVLCYLISICFALELLVFRE